MSNHSNSYSVKSQTNLCSAPSCELTSRILCHHCQDRFCEFCFMCHRKSIFDDMQSMYAQMKTNRRHGIDEVTAFIEKQANDAHGQAKRLIDDAIDRIIQASKHIFKYIDDRRRSKLSRLEECLEEFDKDLSFFETRLKNKTFIPTEVMHYYRCKYVYNMFEKAAPLLDGKATELQHNNELFFDDYRCYKEFINLRQKWIFFQPALTTVYFPTKKDISLDKILNFLEYRHDRVLENYRKFLSEQEDSKELSLKSDDELLNELSFLQKRKPLVEPHNFSIVDEDQPADCPVEDMKQSNQEYDSRENTKVRQENDLTIKTDSGNFDDPTNVVSDSSWQIEDNANVVTNDEYELRFVKLSQSLQELEKQFESDFQLVANNIDVD